MTSSSSMQQQESPRPSTNHRRSADGADEGEGGGSSSSTISLREARPLKASHGSGRRGKHLRGGRERRSSEAGGAPRHPHTRMRGRLRRRSGDEEDTKSFSEMSVRGLDLLRYATISSDGSYRCIECERMQIQKNFKNKYSFQRHAFLYHEGAARKVFPCIICSKEFSRPDKMKSHLKAAHDCVIPKASADAAAAAATTAAAAAASAAATSLSDPAAALLVNPFLAEMGASTSETQAAAAAQYAQLLMSGAAAAASTSAAAAAAAAAASSSPSPSATTVSASAPRDDGPASPPRMTVTRTTRRSLKDSTR